MRGILVLLASLTALADTPPDTLTAAAKLRVYCKACHAVGDQKFIYDDNDDHLWDYILHHDSPVSHKLWAQRIVEVLQWPSEDPPPASQTNWMPRGIKRNQMAGEKTNGVPTRRFIVETIQRYLANGG
jgi:hypothetical protein